MTKFDFATGIKPIKSFSQAGLTDIIFLLLIFFLLTSNFITQFGIKVNVPQAEAGATTSDERLTITITEDNKIFVEQNEVAQDDVINALNTLKGDMEVVVLRADEEASYGVVVSAMNAAQANDLKILVATEREDTALSETSEN